MQYVKGGIISVKYEAFDQNASLNISAQIYDVTNGTSSFVDSISLSITRDGVYTANFTGTIGHAYLVISAVYTEDTFETTDPNYAPDAECWLCIDGVSTTLYFNYATYDQNDALFLAANVFNVTESTSYLATTAMEHIALGVYFGFYVGVLNNSYIVSKAVYTDNSFETVDPNRAPGSDSFQVWNLGANISSDPGINNVRYGISYVINGVNLKGVYAPTPGNVFVPPSMLISVDPANPFPFKSFEAVALSKSDPKILIRWEMALPAEELADFEFYIERSEGQDNIGGFQNVDIHGRPLPRSASSKTNNMQFISLPIPGLEQLWYMDYSQGLKNLSPRVFYRIRARRISTQEEVMTPMFNLEGNLDLVGLYIVDEENFRLRDAAGEPCLIYNRRRSGVLCSCFDKIQSKRTTSSCTKCFNTNWVGGFYDPIDLYVDFTPNPTNAQITQWGETQTNETRVQISNFPIASPGDIIRELRSSRMWRVTNVGRAEKRRALMLQFPNVTEIKPGDVEYKIPVDEQLVLEKIEEFEKTKRRREF